MSAWVKQVASQVAKYGSAKASWYCIWDEPDGGLCSKSCGPGSVGKKLAEQKAKILNGELLKGTYDRAADVKWMDFRKRYLDNVVSSMEPRSRVSVADSLEALERVLRLNDKLVSYVTAERIATFKAERRKERGKKPGSTLSPATVNKDLRQIKAALKLAVEWGYITACPKIRPEKEPQALPRYITPEHFGLIYKACNVATRPTSAPFPAIDWWRGLLTFAQMTGWRISEILSLAWEDVDLDTGTAITCAADNKGKRASIVALHPVVVDHLRPLKSFSVEVFPWPHGEMCLYDHFAKIQEAAGIHLPCRIEREHKCTAACHRYAFHDERRAFATMNAANMTREALKVLMRHKSSTTTDRYINWANQINPAVANLHVPAVLKIG